MIWVALWLYICGVLTTAAHMHTLTGGRVPRRWWMAFLWPITVTFGLIALAWAPD